ncbi:TetR/AcrR family transcriptional regulator [Gottfriedia sp. NPDC056225]|uniref:TetR/AcrR family transcriptional regulator n=1 Tax=Gottfriedia sp. NPDC056225 TaxID=3345751 RepID=UPI0015583629|nr:TetR/AcrR family transcriptional regulator [Arthrobacter citreus]
MNKGERTKHHILEKSIQLFAKNGYDGTTINQIAKESKISEATIYKYFKSKLDVLITCVKPDIQDVWMEEDFSNYSIEDLLRLYVEKRIKWVEKNRNQIEILISETLRHPELSEIFFQQIYRKTPIEEEIEARMLTKQTNLHLEIPILSLSMITTIISILNLQKSVMGKDPMHITDDAINKMVQLILFGLIGNKSPE